MIVTIDGPAGAGKSSAAKQLADRLRFDYLDTGAMYRAVALAALRAGLGSGDETALAQLLESFHLEMPAGRVIVNGEDVSGPIRAAEVTAASSRMAASPVVRHRLVEMQRRIAAGRNIVCEGRDQGTLVFPNAERKFFLVADPMERARRRQAQMAARGEAVSVEEILGAQEERDRRDAGRDLAPMVPAADAILLDSTRLSLDEVVSHMEEEVRRAMAAPSRASEG